MHSIHLCSHVIENHYVARFVNPLTNPLYWIFFSIVSRKSLEKDFYLYNIDPFVMYPEYAWNFYGPPILTMMAVFFCYSFFFGWIHNTCVVVTEKF